MIPIKELSYFRAYDGRYCEQRHQDPHDGNRSRMKMWWKWDILAQASLFPVTNLSAGMVGYITASIKKCEGDPGR